MNRFLDYASSKYYEGNPIISDEEFDMLADYYKYESVGAPVKGDRIAHAFPMYSLQKVYENEPRITLPGVAIAVTPKLDGAAVANYYVYGTHVLSLTRGDGKEGLDITEKMRILIPSTILYGDVPLIQVVGEVVAPKHIENSRNYAAGALNLKCIEEFKQKEITFIAYGIKPNQYSTWTEDMSKLCEVNQFSTVYTSNDLDKYPQDGTVFRLDSYDEFEAAGYTSKHPRGAFALKKRQSGVVTKLLDIEWQVGMSGVLTPVAILEPVKVGDAVVSRATLNNMGFIQAMDLDYNCFVEIERAGEIIPRVIRRVYE